MRKGFKIIGVGILICLLAVLFFLVYNRMNRTYTKHPTTPTAATTPVSTIRVGTYNVKSLGMGNDLDAFVADVKDLDLDIIALQEVDQHALRSGNMDMVAEMAEQAGYSYSYFYPCLWMVSGSYGLGILSRYPIEEISSQLLPTSLLEEPRVLAGALININGYSLQLYHTHLAFKNREDHAQQIKVLQEQLRNVSNTILLGDFNSFRGDTFAIDGMHGVNWGTQPLITFRDFGSPDNIFYSDDLTLLDLQIKQTSFSDHHLLYGEIALQEGA